MEPNYTPIAFNMNFDRTPENWYFNGSQICQMKKLKHQHVPLLFVDLSSHTRVPSCYFLCLTEGGDEDPKKFSQVEQGRHKTHKAEHIPYLAQGRNRCILVQEKKWWPMMATVSEPEPIEWCTSPIDVC